MNKLQLLLILSLLATLGHRLHAATYRVYFPAGLVVVVNERLILDSDIRERLSPAVELLRRQYTNNPALFEQKSIALAEDILESLINDGLILTEAMEAVAPAPRRNPTSSSAPDALRDWVVKRI